MISIPKPLDSEGHTLGYYNRLALWQQGNYNREFAQAQQRHYEELGITVVIDPSMPPDVLEFRQGNRAVGAIVNVGS